MPYFGVKINISPVLFSGKHGSKSFFFNFRISIDDTHENWVGAWWLGPMLLGFFGMISSITVLLLPRVIPDTEKYRKDRNREMHVSEMEQTEEDSGEEEEDEDKEEEFGKG